MRLSLRFLIPLFVALSLLAYIVVPQVDALTVRWFVRDLDSRAQLAAAPLADQLAELIPQQAQARITTLLNRVTQNERLYAIAYCDQSQRIAYRSNNLPPAIGCAEGADEKAVGSTRGEVVGTILALPKGSLHVARIPIRTSDGDVGRLVMVSDMSFIESRSEDTRKYTILLFLVLGVVVSLVTVLVAHLSWRGWIAGVRAMLRGEGVIRPFSGIDGNGGDAGHGRHDFDPELRPLMSDLRGILREADEERRLRESSADDGGAWTPERLRKLLKDHLSDDEIIVVSNREPYIHSKTATGVEVQCPASGLVTAVEPVMRACSGTWIAHGAGSADRDVVDAKDRVMVPPDDPSYTLRRIWLTKEEEEGYYYGFANEGLWPLCHIAHVRPVFRSADWKQYVAVNRRFADAVVAEARTENPVVLVQDYHFALLPRLVRDRLPHATIITFWHIPWPNPESFGICPWRTELIEGLLGSTILGFHTRYQAKNFIETADRFLETRIEHETSQISYGGVRTQVESYPISIDWPDAPQLEKTVADCRQEVRERLALPKDQLLGLGVDRLDYTKGILERFKAVEAMLDRHPEMIGRFTFAQIAAPSRSDLEEYQNFEARVRAEAARINQRFARPAGRSPTNDAPDAIALLIEHHDKNSVFTHYRACDVCVVTSLHDGMNLVAKEFVAARDDEQGVLILSAFAGASRELREALIVNPYHVEHTADMIHAGLTMPPAEQRERMRALRTLVRDHNVFRWAARMLLDASRVRDRERIRARIAEHHSEAEDRGRWREGSRVIDLFGAEGLAALERLSRSRALYAFDFDGTLAPIVAQPDAARAAASTVARLSTLGALVPTVLITGRGVDDLRARIEFTPLHLIGNHGAEGMPDTLRHALAASVSAHTGDEAHRDVVETWRAQWPAAIAAAGGGDGIVVEAKRYSLSIHYRQAEDHDAAKRAIGDAIARLEPAPRLIGGKCVVNLLPEGAPDKGSALRTLVRHEDCEAAFFIGDDLTDEAAFVDAPPSWVTVRVGQDADSAARFFIADQTRIDACLDLLIAHAEAATRPA